VRRQNEKIHVQTKQLIHRWSQAGVKFTFTNQPRIASKLLSIYRRNHSKLYLIDDTATWIGGINMFDNALNIIDIMVKFTDPSFVHVLGEQFAKTNENRPQQNHAVRINADDELLVDAGIMGKSIIYDRAATIIQTAEKSILFASQFVPDGKVLREIINASQRGVGVTIITSNKNHRNFTDFPYNIPYQRLRVKIKNNRQIKILFQNTKVHAKILLVDDTVGLFGSHNLVNIGVLLATEEIAVCTKNKKLISDIKTFVKTHTQ
jgi:phosphatidylserine/phosphatidylglycerophosphate/cardiolipin synthase-like enzyme